MRPTTRQDQEPPLELSAEQEAAVRAVTGWIQQLGRALKTCRLYDAANPTVVKFRSDLFEALRKLTSEHGTVTLRFFSEAIECEGVSIYSSRSRDDNIALPFHRDGVRGLTFDPAIEPRELDALLDAVLAATMPNAIGSGQEENDLVTLLWEAQLSHVDIDFVPAEGDLVGGSGGEGETVPWPTPAAAEPAGQETEAQDESEEQGPRTHRSDDWDTGTQTGEIEANFDVLESVAAREAARFQAQYEAERAAPIVASSLALARAFMAAGARPDDHRELTHLLARVLREAVECGIWVEAGQAIELMMSCQLSDWSSERFVQELMQPISVARLREHLDRQQLESVDTFIAFVSMLGDPAADLLQLVLAEVQGPQQHRRLSEGIARLCQANPERLAPSLADPRWPVVRNTVQILGTIGGEGVVGLLRSAAQHPEPRVRQEVVSALRGVGIQHSRALLVQMLEGADARQFCALMVQLAELRDPGTAYTVLDYLVRPDFERRSPEEQRAIYTTLAAVGGDEVVPVLEEELHKGNWFSRQNEGHRQAVARCIARIGTPQAKTVLERGANSRRGSVRKACALALGSPSS